MQNARLVHRGEHGRSFATRACAAVVRVASPHFQNGCDDSEPSTSALPLCGSAGRATAAAVVGGRPRARLATSCGWSRGESWAVTSDKRRSRLPASLRLAGAGRKRPCRASGSARRPERNVQARRPPAPSARCIAQSLRFLARSP
jgi:hypothetical protein